MILQKFKRFFENISMQFINGNLFTLWFGSILFMVLSYHYKNIIVSTGFTILAYTYFVSLASRLIYLTLIDSFKDTLNAIILNKFIEEKILEVKMTMRQPGKINKTTKVL